MPALLYTHGRPGFYLRVLEEGEVGAGDAIERVAVGPGGDDRARGQRVALPPGPDHARARARLAIPALPEGWRHSFRALLEQLAEGGTGNRGLAPPSSGPPAWPGLRPFRIATSCRRRRRSPRSRSSRSTATRCPRSARGSSSPCASARWGAAGAAAQLLAVRRAGRAPVPARRQARARGRGERAPPRPRRGRRRARGGRPARDVHARPRATRGPVVLLSAGVGATPVLAMLGSLAAAGDEDEVWWIHGARNRAEHAFADEVRRHLAALPGARSHVRFSRPAATDVPGRDYDARGHVTAEVVEDLGVPPAADWYLCGPTAWMRDLSAGLLARGVAPERLHTEVFGSEPLAGAERPPPPAGGRAGRRARGRLHHVGPHRPLGPRLREPARAGRGLRRPGPVVVPDRRVPHVRMRPGRRRGRLPPRPARPPRGGTRADLLRPPGLGRGARALRSRGAELRPPAL